MTSGITSFFKTFSHYEYQSLFFILYIYSDLWVSQLTCISRYEPSLHRFLALSWKLKLTSPNVLNWSSQGTTIYLYAYINVSFNLCNWLAMQQNSDLCGWTLAEGTLLFLTLYYYVTYVPYILYSIHFPSIACSREANHSWHWVRGRVHHGPVPNQSITD